ncbi:MAG: tetratricopeptide repeat protein [Armatimonadota bacterium]
MAPTSTSHSRRLLAAALAISALLPAGASLAQGEGRDPEARRREARAVQLTNQADELIRLRKPGEAAPLVRQAAELVENDPELWDQAGWLYLDAGEAEPALQAFEAERKLLPEGVAPPGGLLISQFALGNRAEVERLIGRLVPADRAAEAVAVAAKGLGAAPRSPDWSYALGYLYARVLGQGPRGLEAMEAVVMAQPDRAEAWLLLVEMNRQLNRGPQEDAAAVEYLKLAPATVDAFRLRGEKYAALQKYADAIAEYEEGIKKHPNAEALYLQLARLHGSLGGTEQAEQVLRRLLARAESEKSPTLRAQANLALANHLIRTRRYPDAEKLYAEMAKAPDASALVVTNWGSLLALKGDWPAAAAALSQAADREAADPENRRPSRQNDVLIARYRAAVARLAAGEKDAARKELDAAAALGGETRTSAGMEVAAFRAYLGDTAAARSLAYSRGDERWAGFLWRRELEDEAGELEVRGRFSAAATGWRAILQEVVRREPQAWPAAYALARVYAAGGATQAAQELLRGAAERKPDWWALYYPRGQYYAQRRDKELGIPLLEQTLKLAPEARQARSLLNLLRNAAEPEPEEPVTPPEGEEPL